jgi:hypothetical protein
MWTFLTSLDTWANLLDVYSISLLEFLSLGEQDWPVRASVVSSFLADSHRTLLEPVLTA